MLALLIVVWYTLVSGEKGIGDESFAYVFVTYISVRHKGPCSEMRVLHMAL